MALKCLSLVEKQENGLASPCLAMCQLLYFSRNLFFNFPKINGNFKDSKKGKDLRSALEKQTVIFHN
jgi:hypothetical protein